MYFVSIWIKYTKLKIWETAYEDENHSLAFSRRQQSFSSDISSKKLEFCMQWVCTYKEPKLETKHMLLIAQNYSSQSSCTICYAIKKNSSSEVKVITTQISSKLFCH